MAHACFPNASQFPIWETLFPVSVFVFKMQHYAYATYARQGILMKIRACELLQKFCEHEQVSTRLIFASNSSKGQILRAVSNWMGLFNTPKAVSFGGAGLCLNPTAQRDNRAVLEATFRGEQFSENNMRIASGKPMLIVRDGRIFSSSSLFSRSLNSNFLCLVPLADRILKILPSRGTACA